MISKKYTSDYTVAYEENRRGKQRLRARYTGEYYTFDLDPEALHLLQIRYLILSLCCLVLLGVLLWLTFLLNGDFRFAALPMAFALVCLALVLAGVWRLWHVGEKLTREQNDKLVNRLPPASLFLMICCVLSLAALIVHLILFGVTVPMLLYTLDALALTVASVLLFLLRRGLKTTKYQTP